ncbi:hypothetical protein ACJJTC_004979 [Scirpophaga incertulas]
MPPIDEVGSRLVSATVHNHQFMNSSGFVARGVRGGGRGVGARGASAAALPGAALLHAALAPPAPREPLRLALTTDRADLLVLPLSLFRYGSWRRAARGGRAGAAAWAPRDWAAAARARWAGPRRLLLAGALATARRWELLALAHVRTGCLALPHSYNRFMTIFLPRAELHSTDSDEVLGGDEPRGHGGGRRGLLGGRGRRRLPHAAAAPSVARALRHRRLAQRLHAGARHRAFSLGTRTVLYYQTWAPSTWSYATTINKNPEIESSFVQMLVAGFSGMRGAVRTWALPALRPAPLLAAADGDLRTRRALHARRRAAAAAVAAAAGDGDPGLLAEAELDEATARALCAPPEYQYLFEDALVGLTVAPGRAQRVGMSRWRRRAVPVIARAASAPPTAPVRRHRSAASGALSALRVPRAGRSLLGGCTFGSHSGSVRAGRPCRERHRHTKMPAIGSSTPVNAL